MSANKLKLTPRFCTWVKSKKFISSSVVLYRGTFNLIHIFELRSKPKKMIIIIQLVLKEVKKIDSEIAKIFTPQKKVDRLS